MKNAVDFYSRAMDVLAKAILGLTALIIGLDVLSIFSEAVGRYLVGHSRAFMEELPRLAVPLVVFPMMGVLLKYNKHIAVEVLPERLSEKARSLLMIVVYSVVLAPSMNTGRWGLRRKPRSYLKHGSPICPFRSASVCLPFLPLSWCAGS
jgi:TRAP-type C4-dicarboxylate transport system permease small subunit